ncbi:MAG: FAD binding domain-containing protein, partial [Candidatus Eremiobacteraeota bacterium]|nr:FAD binding domain-containing protein [Candidatus Eremiobacteraeota bacterium]
MSVAEALGVLAKEGAAARIVAGGTDVLVELQRGVKPTATLIDVSALRELKYVRRAGDVVALGGLATHNDVLAAPFAQAAMLPLAQACIEVGAPQIRARGTIAGNLVTASPANDTIAPLIALEAEIVLASASGERVLALADFYTGFRRTLLRPDE